MEYKVFFTKGNNDVVERIINTSANDGWLLHSIVAGDNWAWIIIARQKF